MARNKQFDEDEVLQKAVHIFWCQGYNATSIDDIVKHLGINRASLYDTFGGKKQLFQKAVSRYVEENTRALNALLSTSSSVKEGIRTLFSIAIEQAVADPERKGCLVVNTSTELMPSDEEIGSLLSLNKVNFEAILTEYLKRGQESGEINSSKDIQATAAYLVTFFNGLKVSSKVNPTKASLSATVELALSVLD
ncbi:TetR/AcrR family transcriptional regulator [Pedobacter sp. SYSU D00535]|uniref:TetR/AcrR family transcriptional regulator n=1 Tax=Pedobacter sp. SYSU D00535 TaxID=2810308 RepID=UPI001A97604F|nr:TetR/AcrR family transcriptional regulator [Pedobacter sp. SYSU D00535]